MPRQGRGSPLRVSSAFLLFQSHLRRSRLDKFVRLPAMVLQVVGDGFLITPKVG